MAKLPGKQGEPERKRKNASAAEAGSQGRRGQSRRKSAASVAKGPEKRKNRPAADAERSAAETSADEAREEARSGGKRVACTLFVGQLPFSVTADDIKAHFLSVCEPPISVRLLTDKKSGKSRGMAFVEMGSESAVHTALRLHHSCICGRRINVERTVGGGHSGEARVNRLKELRDKQGAMMVRTVRELVNKLLPTEDVVESEANVTREDVDERTLEFLSTVAPPVAEAALKEIAQLDLGGVRNRSAYLMGVLRRNVDESDPFAIPKANDEKHGKSRRKTESGKRHSSGSDGSARGSKPWMKNNGTDAKACMKKGEYSPGGGKSTFAVKRRAKAAGMAASDEATTKKRKKRAEA